MKSQQFRNKQTGEVTTLVPLSKIDSYEPYDGRRVFYTAARNTIIDVLDDSAEIGLYGQRNLAEIHAADPDAVIMAQQDAYNLHMSHFIKPVSEITEEKFWYWLEVLYPEDWHNGPDGESFKMCEYTCGDITQIVARVDKRYFTMADSYKMKHREIMGRVKYFIDQQEETERRLKLCREVG